jgi:hypothetical protein
MLLSQIQGENRYVKDLETGAILNTDVTEILKSEVADIKTLLLEIHRKLGD